MAGKVRHLLNRSGRYFARVSVPANLRLAVGKNELLKALGPDRSKALRMLPVAVAEMQGVLASARSQGNAKKALAPRRGKLMSAEQMARAHYDAQMAFDDELRNTDPRFASMGGVDEDYVAALNRAISGAATNDELRNTVGTIVAKFRQSQNTKVVDDTPEWRDLARLLAGAEHESLARTFERDEGDFSGSPILPALTRTDQPLPIDPVAARALGPDSLKPLSEIVDRFAKERKATPSTDREYQVAVRMLEECLGEPRPAYKITRPDIHAFKRALSEVPANATKRFPDRTMLEATRDNKARKTPYPTLNPITINDKWLARIHALLAWCVRNDIIPDNPATGIKVESVRDNSEPSKVNFSPADLTLLFGDEFQAGEKELGERQWAMLISLFSGTRASELAQLKLDSVRTERGILVFTIEEETKTAGSLRIVPVHSKLIELGLEKRVKALRRVGESHLFPEWYTKGMEAKKEARAKGGATLNHYFPRFIPRRFNDTYMPSVGINDSRKSWHCFRHTFKTGLKRAGVVKSMRDELAGHSDDSSGAIYEHEGSVEAMKEAVEKLVFDGFDL